MTWAGLGQASAKFATVTIIFVISLYGAWSVGASMEHNTNQAKIADYEDALAHAQREYDTLKFEATNWITRIEIEKAQLQEHLQLQSLNRDQ